MNPTPDSTGRDVLSEIDEIVRTMHTVLKAVDNMGEEVIRYRTSFTKMVEGLATIQDTQSNNLTALNDLKESMRILDATVTFVTSLDHRLSSIEKITVTLSEISLRVEERVKALEDGYRLILP